MGAHRSRRRAEVGPDLSLDDGAGALGNAGPGSFFGRRKGKALRPGQQRLVDELLPGLLVDPARPGFDPAGLFGRKVDGLHLEIGFGGGEHLAAAAVASPATGFIGCEPFVNGMAKLLARIEPDGLANIRLWDRDAAELLDGLPPGCLARVYLLFPDPWPKRRQRKRRFVSGENLDRLARTMAPGAELRFATDIDDYAGWALARVLPRGDFAWTAARPHDWRVAWPDWPGTRYEAKTGLAGRPASYLTFVRR